MQRERVKWNLSVVADTFLLKQIIKYYDVSNWNSSTKHVNMNISMEILAFMDFSTVSHQSRLMTNLLCQYNKCTNLIVNQLAYKLY